MDPRLTLVTTMTISLMRRMRRMRTDLRRRKSKNRWNQDRRMKVKAMNSRAKKSMMMTLKRASKTRSTMGRVTKCKHLCQALRLS